MEARGCISISTSHRQAREVPITAGDKGSHWSFVVVNFAVEKGMHRVDDDCKCIDPLLHAKI